MIYQYDCVFMHMIFFFEGAKMDIWKDFPWGIIMYISSHRPDCPSPCVGKPSLLQCYSARHWMVVRFTPLTSKRERQKKKKNIFQQLMTWVISFAMIHWVLAGWVSITCTDEIETRLNNSGQVVESLFRCRDEGTSMGHWVSTVLQSVETGVW